MWERGGHDERREAGAPPSSRAPSSRARSRRARSLARLVRELDGDGQLLVEARRGRLAHVHAQALRDARGGFARLGDLDERRLATLTRRGHALGDLARARARRTRGGAPARRRRVGVERGRARQERECQRTPHRRPSDEPRGRHSKWLQAAADPRVLALGTQRGTGRAVMNHDHGVAQWPGEHTEQV